VIYRANLLEVSSLESNKPLSRIVIQMNGTKSTGPSRAGRSNVPTSSKFWQQEFSGTSFIYTPKRTAVMLFVASMLFFALSSPMWYANSCNSKSALLEYSERYDDVEGCKDSRGRCRIVVEVEEDMDEPIYLYYEMVNFYQNHIEFVKSRDYPQLRGESRSKSDLKTCGSFKTMDDMLNKAQLAVRRYTGDEIASPCGLAAKYYPNENFIVRDADGVEIEVKHAEIAWTSDSDYVFKEADDDNPWIDVEDGKAYSERFMTWMRTAPQTTFRKLWGVIKNDMDEGYYTVQISNSFDVSNWDGEKHIVLATANQFGGRSFALSTTLFVAGALSFVGAVAGFAMSMKKSKVFTTNDHSYQSKDDTTVHQYS
jgi:hypothetical protein